MSVTVVVPTRDRQEYLPGLLAALAAQTHDGYDVVFVDDGSSDDTAAIIEAAAAEDPRIRLIRTDNRGPAAARNMAIDAVDTEWLAFTDDDCLPTPGWLAGMLAAAADGPDVVQGATASDPDVDPATLPLFARGKNVAEWSNRFQMCNLLVRRSRLLDVGGLDERFPPHGFGEDTDLGLRMVAAGATTAFAGDALVYHRMIPMTFTGFLRRRWRWAQVVRVAALSPDGRSTFPHRYVAQRSHAAFWIGVPVSAVAVRSGRPWVPAVGIAAFMAKRAVAGRRTTSPLPTRLLRAPGELAGVAVESVAFAVQSIRFRTPLL